MGRGRNNLPVAQTSQTMSPSFPLRLLTWNIRYDWLSSTSETKWSSRREQFCTLLEYHSSTSHGIIALQEVLHHQLLDILKLLNNDSTGKWKYIGVGRDD